MTAPHAFDDEQIRSMYADFAKTAVDEFNANGGFIPAIVFLKLADDGKIDYGSMPDQITFSLLGGEPGRVESAIANFLTEGSPIRAKLDPAPDAVVIVAQARAMVVKTEDGKPPKMDANMVRQTLESGEEVLSVQFFTGTSVWAGASKIIPGENGAAPRAEFNAECNKVASFVSAPMPKADPEPAPEAEPSRIILPY